MSLIQRITLKRDGPDQAEDFFAEALGVIFPDDITNMHGDAESSIIYTSPHLAKPLLIEVADPTKEQDRLLFSHFLWNASLQLAEFVEADTLGIKLDNPRRAQDALSFDIKGLDTLEMGAGTALPSIFGGLLGARRVVITDYPTEPVLKTLRTNIARCIQPANSPEGSTTTPASSIQVQGHIWGELEDSFGVENQHAFDRIIVCDCLWMPNQHANLRTSIAHFLRKSPDARVWVIAGFHSGRPKMSLFYGAEFLRQAGLEIEHIWERDCDGVERAWDPEMEDLNVSLRKRWLSIASIKWIQTP